MNLNKDLWKIIVEKTYNNCEGKNFGDFPFFIVKSYLFGDRLISVPFLDVGGPSEKISSSLVDKIIKFANYKKLIKIEVRTNTFSKNFKNVEKILLKNGFEKNAEKSQFIISLLSEEKMWKNFHKHTRNDIRKSEKSGLVLKKIDSEKELENFYFLYLKEMKNFGTPQHSYEFFLNLMKEMGENFFGISCYKNEKIIGSLIALYEEKYGYIGFNVSDRENLQFRPNDFLYWPTIKHSIKRKSEYLDLGQVEKNASKGSRAHGLYKFKNKWLGTLYERIYFTYSFEKLENADNREKLKKLRSFWKKLPLPLIRLIGPKITRELGI